MQLPRLLAQDLQRGIKIQERRKAELSFDVCKCKLQTWAEHTVNKDH